jgi:thymidylate synthase ThyX
MIEDIIADPAMPMFWGKNQKGMQAGEECNETVNAKNFFDVSHPVNLTREDAWIAAMHKAIAIARSFNKAGYHKQIVNRLLEPFMHINVVVTSTEWSNFYALRDHSDAEPHIALLAHKMREAAHLSTARITMFEDWHLPYVSMEEVMDYGYEKAIKMSTARCARVSYLTHDGRTPTVQEDLELYARLVESTPLHASPAEHQASPDPHGEYRAKWGNFQYWRQHRKMLRGECQ